VGVLLSLSLSRYVFSTLRRLMATDTVDKVRAAMSLTADGHGAVFDVPSELVQTFLDGEFPRLQTEHSGTVCLWSTLWGPLGGLSQRRREPSELVQQFLDGEPQPVERTPWMVCLWSTL